MLMFPFYSDLGEFDELSVRDLAEDIELAARDDSEIAALVERDPLFILLSARCVLGSQYKLAAKSDECLK